MTPGTPREKRYDCVLMDLEMPVMDGYTAARRVRNDEKAGCLVSTIIVALSKCWAWALWSLVVIGAPGSGDPGLGQNRSVSWI